MLDTAIRTTGLGRRFGEADAVHGVNLAVSRGEVYGFLGPNGAGKSTTVRMLCTLLAPTSGTAEVAGFDVDTQPNDVRLSSRRGAVGARCVVLMLLLSHDGQFLLLFLPAVLLLSRVRVVLLGVLVTVLSSSSGGAVLSGVVAVVGGGCCCCCCVFLSAPLGVANSSLRLCIRPPPLSRPPRRTPHGDIDDRQRRHVLCDSTLRKKKKESQTAFFLVEDDSRSQTFDANFLCVRVDEKQVRA